MNRIRSLISRGILSAAASLCAVGPLSHAAANDPDAAGIEFFEKRIRPVLIKHCYKCHSSESGESEGGLLLDSRSAVRKGGDSGAAVVSGEVEASLLIGAIRYESLQMPPNEQLPSHVIDDFVNWVQMGAPDPRTDDAVGSSPQPGESDFWAFQPPRRPPAPKLQNNAWPNSAIDEFVLAQLESQGIQPVSTADRSSLLRRVCFDLVGLPPSPEQLWAFVSDQAPTSIALERIVDRLLDSPHFGERWGRHWLDVARFAESTGKEWNWAHPQAWRYRDYVIQSLNEDKPYDQFLTEQIAGDLLPYDNRDQRDQQLIATGFLAIGPKSVSIGDNETFGLDLADEQINTVFRSTLGLTVGCARCHDHKFDPIPASDYYALSGIFLSTETLFGTAAAGFKGRNNKQGRPLVPIGPRADKLQNAYDRYTTQVQALSATLTRQRDELKKMTEGSDEGQSEPTGQDEAKVSQLREAIDVGQQELDRLQRNPPSQPMYAMGVRDGPVVDCQLRIAGDPKERGESVPRGFLTALQLDDICVNPAQSGRRELARWLTHPRNPLTARVMVNRIWQHLFGHGLVATVDNFGWLGRRPSHPQLLDDLAVAFMEQGWSIKSIIRRIVLSRTYQLSTAYDPLQAQKDPENKYYWRMTPRRLEAEQIRDAMLAISGRLKREPLRGSPAVTHLDAGWIGNEVKEPKFKNYTHVHRSIYLPIVRDQVPEMLQTFDFPNPAEVSGLREVTTVPAQALFLMNSDFVVACARKSAEHRLLDEVPGPERIDSVYRAVFSRLPLPAERQRDLRMIADVERVLRDQGWSQQQARRDAWAALFQAMFSSGEFLLLL